MFASCYVTNHLPLCKCDQGYTGDAFVSCQRITTCKFNEFQKYLNLSEFLFVYSTLKVLKNIKNFFV